MEYIVIASFNILFLLGIWIFGFKRAIKDRKRIELLILKSQVKSYFMSNYGLKHRAYESLTEMIDRKVKALDSISLSSYIAWSIEIDKLPEVKQALANESKAGYCYKDDELREFCEEVRDKSTHIAIGYMIEASFFANSFYRLYTVYYFLKEIINKGRVQLEEVTSKVEIKTEKLIKPSFIEQEILCQ